MTSKYDKWDLEQARKAIPSKTKTENTRLVEAIPFYNGDHWQEGKGWIGPWPLGVNISGEGLAGLSISTEIRKSFTPKNAIREVVDRHVSGVVGKAVHWKLTPREIPGEAEPTPQGEVEGLQVPTSPTPSLPPNGVVPPLPGEPVLEEDTTDPGEETTPEDQALIDEAESFLTNWWEARQIDEVIEWATTSLCLKQRSFLRLFIPPDMVTEEGTLNPETLEEAFDLIYLHHPGYDEENMSYVDTKANVWRDKTNMQQVGVYLYKDDKSQEFVELSYLDEEKLTVIRIIGQNDGGVANQTTLDMGGHLAHYLMVRPAIIDDTVMAQQLALNLALSMKNRNVVLGGFLERTILNARMPGKLVTDPETSEEYFQEDPYYVGMGVTNNLIGITDIGEDGSEKTVTPSIVYRDPVSVETFERTERGAYRNILEETHQLHYLISGDAEASGESRKQSREAYQKDLFKTAAKVQNLVQWILESVMNLAASLAGDPGKYASLRAFAEVRTDPGPVSADEARMWMDASDRRYVSRERVMSLLGVEDVDAEMSRIDQEESRGGEDVLSQIDQVVRGALEVGDNPQDTLPNEQTGGPSFVPGGGGGSPLF